MPACLSRAEVRLPAIFSDHMVLQRDHEIPVWGSAGAGEKLEVSLGSSAVEVKADAQGNWVAKLPARPASIDPLTLTISGSSTVTFSDVLVGDVWVCSGQSNIEWPLRLSTGGETAASQASLPQIRHFKVAQAIAHSPAADVSGNWAVCSPETAPHFTGIGFFFARELHQSLRVPIGILNTSWGGTPIESWMAPSMIKDAGEAGSIGKLWQKTLDEYPAKKAAYDKELAAWQKTAETAKAQGLPPPPNQPWRPAGPGLPEEPMTLWNGMVAPLVPYAIRGFVWYQGETSVGRDVQYRALFPALIQGWRKAWTLGQPGFGKHDPSALPLPSEKALEKIPFLFVQLPNFDDAGSTNHSWAFMREAQASVLSTIPATAMAVALDVGEDANLHPTDKRPVGHRLALLARAKVFGEKIASTGPQFADCKIEKSGIRVNFTSVEGRLLSTGESLNGFAVAGADRVFHPASARIEGNSVVVASDAVSSPIAVRYAFVNAPKPKASLTDESGLPAAPFRSDTW